jgi:AcrR family transcriptional regulator
MASVTRKTQSSRARRREEIQARLLDAVEQMLADGESYTEVSVERLVQHADISRSTFYVYFEDKGDLLRAWFAQITGLLEGAAGDWWSLEGDISRADVHAALDRITRAYRPHAALMAAVYDAATYDLAVRDEVRGMIDFNTAGLRKHIRTGQQAGWVATNLPAAETAAWLTWMAERGFHRMLRDAADEDVAGVVDAYTDVVWNALYRFAPNRADGAAAARAA